VQPSTCRTSDRHASRGTQRKQQGTDVNLEIDGRGCNIISITHKAFLFCTQFVARMSLFNIRLRHGAAVHDSNMFLASALAFSPEAARPVSVLACTEAL